MSWIYWLIGIIIAFIISLLFESARDFYIDVLSSIWEFLQDGFSYIFSFEWLGDIWDFISAIPEAMTEFSMMGILGSAIGVSFLWVTNKWVLNSFLQYMTPTNKIIYSVIIYVGTAIIGYIWFSVYDNN
jgi:hypothetical protein